MLKQTIIELKEKHEAFKKESNAETTTLLKKYAQSVVVLHQRLKSLAESFEQIETLKKSQFRKVRKVMEKELQKIRAANEKLFQSSSQVQ